MGRVVVLGGGFAGHCVACYLSQLLDGSWEVCLFDPKDYFENNIGSVRTPVRPDLVNKVIMNFTDFIPQRVRLVQGWCSQLSEGSLTYTPVQQPAREERLEFDYCVVATGRAHHDPFLPRGNRAERQEQMAKLHAQLQSARSVVIAGGGIVGTEFAGELVQTWPQMKVTIVHPGHRLVDTACPSEA